MAEGAAGPVRDPRADALRARYHELFGGTEVPVPVESIAEDLLGLSIHESPDLECSGMLIPARREIWINANEREYAGRPRFTVAHEVAHWICHWLEGRTQQPVYCRHEDVGAGDGRLLEREANLFAAELLMPEAAVRSRWAASQSIQVCARGLGVSGKAVHWRLHNFGLIDAP